MMKIMDKLEENSSNPVFLALLVGFFAGIVIGFIASPVKRGIAIGSYNGCNNRISDSNKVNKDKHDK